MTPIMMVIEGINTHYFLVGVVGSLEEASAYLRMYREIDRNNKQVAIEYMKNKGFEEVEGELELPDKDVLFCMLEVGPYSGIYETKPDVIFERDTWNNNLPPPMMTLEAFFRLCDPGRNNHICEDPTCEAGLGDCCG